MKTINWNAEKNQLLIKERGVCFEDVIFALQSESLLDDGPHPNSINYPNQRMMIVEIAEYAWLVPYIENEEEIFLKTMTPNRKAIKQCLGDRHDK